eukprot:TRINITY_DN1201_c0_g1_i5.p1 TRINITY_DN1201_c0_g1~~TRINITY_DN1201_c0_g1_i5.p1  ORF type:complete len:904 (-),score=314.07 TRINITY_DN1201_c0_g1_i5:243-2954(-)
MPSRATKAVMKTMKLSKSNVKKTKKSKRFTPKEKIVKQINPFERRIVRSKQNVLGKKLKTSQTKIGEQRAKSIEIRRKTIGLELNEKNKKNAFIDSRIGIHDKNIPEDEKILRRFQKERQRQATKLSKYNLTDPEELTHLGTSISDDNANDFIMDSESDEETGRIDADFVKKLHFGGGYISELNDDENSKTPKTRQEIMQEIIQKSKLHKVEKAKQMQERLDLTEELDNQMHLVNKLLKQEEDKFKKKLESMPKESEEVDEFDKLVREFAFEAKTAPTDRRKSEEELAMVERKRLESLERERIKRMNQDEEEISNFRSGDALEDEEDYEQSTNTKSTLLFNKYNEIEGEEEGEEEEVEEEGEQGEQEYENYEIEQIDEGEEEVEQEYENYEIEQIDEGEEEVEQEYENYEIEQVGEDEEYNEEYETEQGNEATYEENQKDEKINYSIPFVISVPTVENDFYKLIQNHNVNNIIEIINRIVKYNNALLSARNKLQIKKFIPIILTYYFNACFKKLNFDGEENKFLVENIYPILVALVPQFPYDFGMQIAKSLSMLLNKFKTTKKIECLEGLVLFLQFVSIIFPSSDRLHCVITPLFHLVSLILSKYTFSSVNEVFYGLMLTNIILNMLKSTKRYSGEAISFLVQVLCKFAQVFKDKSIIDSINEISYIFKRFNLNFSLDDESLLNLFNLELANFKKQIDQQINLKFKSDLFFSNPEIKCVTIIHYASKLLHDFINLNSEISAIPELLKTVLPLLDTVVINFQKLKFKFAENLKNYQEEIKRSIEVKLNCRQPMQLQRTQKIPVGLRQFTPKFEDRHLYRKKLTGQERNKTFKNRYNREYKGAVRELRKDNYFIASEKQKKMQTQKEENKQKTKKIMSMLEKEQSTINQAEKAKKLQTKKKFKTF